MALDEPRAAAREAAAPVAMQERTPQRGRNRSGAGADLHDVAVLVVSHHHPARVAGQAPGRFRGNARAVLEDGLARLLRVGEDGGIDVDHDLIALGQWAGIDAVVQRRLREQGEGIRLLLDHRGRFRGNVYRLGVPILGLHARLLIQALAGGGQRLHEQRPDLGRQPPSQSHHAVVILIHVQGAARVLPSRLTGLGLPVHAAPATDDALDVGGGARLGHGEQALFGFGGGHAGDRAGLGVRDLSARQRLGEQRERCERARHSDPLARGAGLQAHAPGQPGGFFVDDFPMTSSGRIQKVRLRDEALRRLGPTGPRG
jgi:hypothetical protein